MSALDAMIDAVLTCSRCGAVGPVLSCDCFLRMRCPVCDKTRLVTRVTIDPPSAVELRYTCPEHRSGGGDDAVVYVDRLGMEVPL